MPVLDGEAWGERPLSDRQVRVLLTSVVVVAACGLLYELIVGTLSSYLLGNSTLHFSLTIGGFMTAMGLGSLLSRRIDGDPLRAFVAVELAIGAAGGGSALALYAAYSFAPVAYHAVMAASVLAIGVLVGLEIPLVARVLDAAGRQRRDTVADVLAVDYLGALVAALAFPFLLLPTLGVLRTAFVTGAVNLAVVAACLWAFRRALGGAWRPLAVATVGLAVPLVGGAVGAGWLSHQLEARLYRAPIVYAEQSPYQRLVVTRQRGDTRLFLDGALQFATSDEYRYHEALVHPALALAARRTHVLVLGGGDGLATREILKWPDVERVTLVDLDPAVTDLAQRHPAILEANGGALADPRVEIVTDDAYRFVAGAPGAGPAALTFDAVIVDLPDPNHEALAKLYSRPFYELLRQRLGQGATVAVQSTSPYFAREAFWSIVATAEAAGLHPVPYHVYVPSFGDWGFVLGSTHAVRPERFRLPDGLATRFLTPAAFASAQDFSPDIGRLDVDVNTLDDPVLLRYYQQGWARWE